MVGIALAMALCLSHTSAMTNPPSTPNHSVFLIPAPDVPIPLSEIDEKPTFNPSRTPDATTAAVSLTQLPESTVPPFELNEDVIARQDLPLDGEIPPDEDAIEISEVTRTAAPARYARKRLPKTMHFGLSLTSLCIVGTVLLVSTFLLMYCYRRPQTIEWKQSEVPLLLIEVQS
jgi:hypothetical protein